MAIGHAGAGTHVTASGPGPDPDQSLQRPVRPGDRGCRGLPRAGPPAYDEQEFRDAAHERAQRGTSCWLDGRCRLHNAYLYDAEIIPRVVKAIEHDGGFGNTSLWLLGQRRQVTLMGCVQSQDQARRLERLTARIDDVEQVVNRLIVGKPSGVAPYPAAGR